MKVGIMRTSALIGLAIFIFSRSARAQSVPSSELVERLEANRSYFSDLDSGPSLREQARSENKDISKNRIVLETAMLCDGCPPADPTDQPEVKRVQESDLVIVGHVVRKISALTTRESFVFSDSQVVVDEVWHARKNSEDVSPKNEITAVTPGGTVVSDGHKLTTSLSNETQPVVAHRYLLFLKYLPLSKSYTPVSLLGFDLTGDGIKPVRTSLDPPAKELLGNQHLYLQSLHACADRQIEEEGSDLFSSNQAEIATTSVLRRLLRNRSTPSATSRTESRLLHLHGEQSV